MGSEDATLHATDSWPLPNKNTKATSSHEVVIQENDVVLAIDLQDEAEEGQTGSVFASRKVILREEQGKQIPNEQQLSQQEDDDDDDTLVLFAVQPCVWIQKPIVFFGFDDFKNFVELHATQNHQQTKQQQKNNTAEKQATQQVPSTVLLNYRICDDLTQAHAYVDNKGHQNRKRKKTSDSNENNDTSSKRRDTTNQNSNENLNSIATAPHNNTNNNTNRLGGAAWDSTILQQMQQQLQALQSQVVSLQRTDLELRNSLNAEAIERNRQLIRLNQADMELRNTINTDRMERNRQLTSLQQTDVELHNAINTDRMERNRQLAVLQQADVDLRNSINTDRVERNRQLEGLQQVDTELCNTIATNTAEYSLQIHALKTQMRQLTELQARQSNSAPNGPVNNPVVAQPPQQQPPPNGPVNNPAVAQPPQQQPQTNPTPQPNANTATNNDNTDDNNDTEDDAEQQTQQEEQPGDKKRPKQGLKACSTATLSSAPRCLYKLWEEYENGLDGRRPARLFTPREIRTLAESYYRRRVIWDYIGSMVRRGYPVKVAVERIREAYGNDTPLSTIMVRMKKERRLEILPASLDWEDPYYKPEKQSAAHDILNQTPEDVYQQTDPTPQHDANTTTNSNNSDTAKDARQERQQEESPGYEYKRPKRGLKVGTASLSPAPKCFYKLWEEYQNGIEGKRPVRLFTARECHDLGESFLRRRVIWDYIGFMVRRGHPVKVAVERIKTAYGEKTTMSNIMVQMKKDRFYNTLPEVLGWEDPSQTAEADKYLLTPKNDKATLSPTPKNLSQLSQKAESDKNLLATENDETTLSPTPKNLSQLSKTVEADKNLLATANDEATLSPNPKNLSQVSQTAEADKNLLATENDDATLSPTPKNLSQLSQTARGGQQSLAPENDETTLSPTPKDLSQPSQTVEAGKNLLPPETTKLP